MGKIDIAGEGIVGAAATGEIGCVVSGGLEAAVESLDPVEASTWSDVTRGTGCASLIEDAPNRFPDGRAVVEGNDVRVRSEEFAKKLGIPEEESLFCGVGGLKEMTGTADWVAGKAEGIEKVDLDRSGVREKGRAGIGGSLAGSGGVTSATEVV